MNRTPRAELENDQSSSKAWRRFAYIAIFCTTVLKALLLWGILVKRPDALTTLDTESYVATAKALFFDGAASQGRVASAGSGEGVVLQHAAVVDVTHGGMKQRLARNLFANASSPTRPGACGDALRCSGGL